MAGVYDRIGAGYRAVRRPDPRIAAIIRKAIGDATTVLDVGAGTGSYEPSDVRVLAVEPSAVMVAQRPAGAAPVVRGVAEALPVADGAVDVAMASQTHHHWTDAARGLAEMRRVSRRQVVFTWDQTVAAREFWLVRDYLPEVSERERGLPALDAAVQALGPDVSVVPVPVPHDCVDGFLAAYWRRPEAYLDPAVRAGISGLALLDQRLVERAVARLAADLADGTWARRYADLAARAELDVGYCLVIAGS
jgi:SAM-dependent methyltransferase